MTGASPVLDRPALWASLSNMQIDLPGSRRFERALADQQGYSTGFAERVTGEYRRFLYLAATAGFEVTPSCPVDEAWHLHLASPHYEEGLCERILGRRLEHRPGVGEPGEEERHRHQYEATLALYESVFGKPPPVDIWPRPLAHAGAATKRPRAARIADRIAAGAAIAAIGAYFLGYQATALILGSTALVFAVPALLVSARSGGTAGCGGGGCGGGSHGGGNADGNDCGSSCGGGCGGD